MQVNHYGGVKTSKKVTTKYFDNLGPPGVKQEETTQDSFVNCTSLMPDTEFIEGKNTA